MHISISSAGSICKLSKTDENRIREVRKLCDAIERHSDDKALRDLAKQADESLTGILSALDKAVLAGTTQKAAS